MEIEFRAWDTFNGRFHYATMNQLLNGYKPCDMRVAAQEGQTKEPEQYTNSKDIDNKKIFAGDTVIIADDEAGSEIPIRFFGVVKFIESGFYVCNDYLQLSFPVFQEIAKWKITGIFMKTKVLAGFIPGKKTKRPKKTKVVIGNYRFEINGSLREFLERKSIISDMARADVK